jgi:hypothetical protein
MQDIFLSDSGMAMAFSVVKAFCIAVPLLADVVTAVCRTVRSLYYSIPGHPFCAIV